MGADVLTIISLMQDGVEHRIKLRLKAGKSEGNLFVILDTPPERVMRLFERNPKIDLSAYERSRQIDKIFADMGIKLRGYRLTPPFGGSPIHLRSVFGQRLR